MSKFLIKGMILSFLFYIICDICYLDYIKSKRKQERINVKNKLSLLHKHTLKYASNGKYKKAVYQIISFEEGGFLKDDAGKGECNLGVLQSTLDIAVKKGIVSNKNIKKITHNDARNIMFSLYWDRYKLYMMYGAGKIKSAAYLLDWTFNSGRNGIKCLQGHLGIKITGNINKSTVEAVKHISDTDMLLIMSVLRSSYYRGIGQHKYSRYLKGWLKRTKRTYKKCAELKYI